MLASVRSGIGRCRSAPNGIHRALPSAKNQDGRRAVGRIIRHIIEAQRRYDVDARGAGPGTTSDHDLAIGLPSSSHFDPAPDQRLRGIPAQHGRIEPHRFPCEALCLRRIGGSNLPMPLQLPDTESDETRARGQSDQREQNQSGRCVPSGSHAATFASGLSFCNAACPPRRQIASFNTAGVAKWQTQGT